MSLLAPDHPNAVEARELRRHEIEHAARCLYRDPTWIDRDGTLPVLDWLRRIHYLRDKQVLRWIAAAGISDPLKAVGELSSDERRQLIAQMLRFLKGAGA